MSDRRRLRLDDLGRALDRFDEALAVPRDAPLAVDGTVRRFEFSFELAWKAIKDALAAEGIEEQTPRSVLRAAFAAGWLPDETAWLDMLDDRNLTSHTYEEALALALYGRLGAHAATLRAVYVVLRRRSESPPSGDDPF